MQKCFHVQAQSFTSSETELKVRLFTNNWNLSRSLFSIVEDRFREEIKIVQF